MSYNLLEYDDIFGFESNDLEINKTFTFRSKFKISDISGYKLILNRLYKRSLSKDDFIFLDKIIKEKFPISINEISGIDIESFSINRIYDGIFELNHYENNTFDISLNDSLDD